MNLSYYAPAEFRLFYEVSGDVRWLELVDTAYWMLKKVQDSFDGRDGTGLVPDWCMVTDEGEIVRMPGKEAIYGWEAVRVPFRIGADWLTSRDRRAFRVLKRFARVFERELKATGRVCSTYDYPCTPVDTRENPMFYAAAFIAAEAAIPSLSPTCLQQLRGYLRQDADGLYYLSPKDYYPNSLCWLPEYYLTIPKQQNQDP